ncbi:phage tail tape measure protein [Chryseobacterium oncorhynchi]|uniref:Phage tail tape measure protein n=1 Tax=Chryseobacterium oncorhynchi TaxID=741074 RepID=A0A316WMG1_9FLAO|nr:phage tail tape measure protein [Chryseobacterium oncorhynchi]PWN62309.1 phage tail tape measure protein [Chryseobacterium oncorhynchi]
MNNDLLYNILLKMQGQNAVVAQVNDVQKKTSNMVKNIQGQISSIKMSAVIDQIEKVSTSITQLNGPGMKLSTSMHDLQAMTGVAGQKLKEIEGYARNSAKTFGGSASEGVESYKLILGQLSPEIAKVPTALKSMGETVGYTSKLMGGDTTAATETLTTAMNQYGISLEDPTKASKIMAAMMNVMAAAAGEGSAELPQIKQALEQSGMAAKAAGVSFEETNASIQVLDKAGKKGSEGGVALRNVLATLGQGRFLPKAVRAEFKGLGIDINKLSDPSLSLTQRLNMLKPLLNDSALMSAVFGKENSNAALALISQTSEVDKLTKAVKGTSVAYEQAAIIMESPEEKNKRLQAQIDDFKITLFNASNGMMGYAEIVSQQAQMVAGLAPLYNLTSSAVTKLVGAQRLQNLWNAITAASSRVLAASMWGIPIVWIVAGIVALIAIVAVCWNKFEGFRTVIFKGWEAMKLFGNVIKDYVINRFKEMLSGVTGIGAALLAFFKGDWKTAWETGKKAAMDLTGAGSTLTALNQVKNGWKGAMSAGQKSSNEYTKNKNAKDAEKKSGIEAPVGIPGTGGTGGTGGKGDGDDEAKKKAKKTSDTIATGGTKHNYITIHIQEQIGIKGYNGSQSSAATTAGQQILDELLRATASATTAAS